MKRNRSSSAFNIAYCGIVAALSLVVMFVTVIPAFCYVVPAFTGIIVWSVSAQINLRWGFLTYAAVAILSFFLVPEIEGKIYFIFFFGHYPLMRELIHRIRLRLMRGVVKLAVFNVTTVSSFLIVVRVFAIADALDELAMFGVSGIYVFWALGNISFWLYDLFITYYFQIFNESIKPKLNKKIK
jgi:hypothetical protein